MSTNYAPFACQEEQIVTFHEEWHEDSARGVDGFCVEAFQA